MFPSIIPAKRRVRRRRGGAESTGAPVLVAASFNMGAVYTVTLAFDRAIDVSGIDGAAIVVDDALFDKLRFTATGAIEVLSASSLRIELIEAGEDTGTGQTLTASADNGIVAVHGRLPWPGVSDLPLPFEAE